VTWRIHAPVQHAVALEDAATEAFRTWTSPTCVRLDARGGGLTAGPGVTGDGALTIEWVERGWSARGYPASRAATTEVLYARDEAGVWRIADADVFLNAVDYEWSGPTAKHDLTAVVTHEVGHALGLLHACELEGDGPACTDAMRDLTMYPAYLGADQRTLAADDIAGICFLYGPGPCEGEACGGGAFGDACDTGDDCTSRLCLVDGQAPFCTEACATGGVACDERWTCRPVDGRRVCAPPAPASGCAVAATARSRRGPTAVLSLFASFSLASICLWRKPR
jgi:hypothetical protein